MGIGRFLQDLLFIRWQLVKVKSVHIENDRPHLFEIIPRGLDSFTDFQSHFLCSGIIRRGVNVMLMGFPYVVENGAPCFVCHMAEEILFLYFCGKNRLRIEVIFRLLIFTGNKLSLFSQRLIKGAEGSGDVTVYVNLRVDHKLLNYHW
nr:hypothetical protein [Agathobaculum massiliense]